MLSIFNTHVSAKAIESVGNTLKSTYLSEGKLVKEFEYQLHSKLGLKNPVALNSGTSALHLALVLAGVGEGDEVIIPAQTFVATGLVVLQQKAKVVFADIEYKTGNISVESIRQKITEKTKAIIVVHWGGYPCDMDEINVIAAQNNIAVIEDAAHALGAKYKELSIGEVSDFTCFSFQAIKHVTTGDGGAICCNDSLHYMKALKLRWFGIDRANSKQTILGEREYDIDEMGFKYHLNDYGAALGLANLENFTERLQRLQIIASLYDSKLAKTSGVNLFEYKTDRSSAYWLYGFHVEKREDFIRMMADKGIQVSVVHLGVDHNSVFGGKDYSLENQRLFDASQIHIPIHSEITLEQAEFVIDAIKSGW